MQEVRDAAWETVGWFVSATATVGMTRGQTMRLSVINIGARAVSIIGALTSNPAPLLEHSYTLGPGESLDIDLPGERVLEPKFDTKGRLQVRAFLRSSEDTVRGNLEVFDDRTGRTTIVVPLLSAAG